MKRSTPLKRTAFKRKAPERKPQVAPELARALTSLLAAPAAPRARMAAVLCAEVSAPMPKAPTFRSEAWLAAVRSIPCVKCGKPAEAAHRNEAKGMGIKADDALTAALCREHHAEIDQGRHMTREERRAEIDRCIVLTVRELARAGKLRIA